MASTQSIKPRQLKQPVMLPGILSVALAAGTLLFIEHFDVAYGLQKYFSASATNMKQLQAASGNSYFASIKTIFVLILIVFVLYAVFYLVFFECIALLYFLVSSKWRSPQVFISYKNTADDSKTGTTDIALTIKKCWKKMDLRCTFLNILK